MKTPTDKIAFKTRLKQWAELLIEQRVAAARAAMNMAQASANEEEKSSAGDKYETARAMSHLERDMHARQLMAHLHELSSLQSIVADGLFDAPRTGACVVCEEALFFIAAGLGKQVVDAVPVIFLSPASPLAKSMTGKSKGDSIAYNGQLTIIEIY